MTEFSAVSAYNPGVDRSSIGGIVIDEKHGGRSSLHSLSRAGSMSLAVERALVDLGRPALPLTQSRDVAIRSVARRAVARACDILFLVAFGSVLDGITGLLDLLSCFLHRLVDFLARFLCRAFLLLAAR